MRKKNKNLHRYVVGTEPGHHHNSFVLDMVDRNDVNNLAGRKKMFNWFYFFAYKAYGKLCSHNTRGCGTA